MSEDRSKFVVEPRDNSGKGVARKLRADGLIPAVVYGAGVDETRAVTANPEELYKLLTGPRRTNLVFGLQINGGSSYDRVMVREYQIDPIRQELLHADFVSVDPEAPVRVTVPVTTTGRPRGVREGGRLQMVRAEVPIVCKPDDIPERIEHDITPLRRGDSLLASELDLGEGIEPGFDVDYAVARVIVPRGTKKGAEGEAGAEEAAEA